MARAASQARCRCTVLPSIICALLVLAQMYNVAPHDAGIDMHLIRPWQQCIDVELHYRVDHSPAFSPLRLGSTHCCSQ